MTDTTSPRSPQSGEDPLGLTAAEVQARIADGRVNAVPNDPVRSTGQIFWANIFNPVNAIMLVLFALILVAGFPADGLFVGVVVSNSVIGIAQELYARRELEKLQLLNAPKATVVRDGVQIEVEVEDIVADDTVALAPGDQVVVDGAVISSGGLELDESLLTGESDPIVKGPDDDVLSGSFVSSGSGFYTATRIGSESYASSLAEEAREFNLVDSELRKGINIILKALIVIIPFASALLIFSLLDVEDRWQEALQGTVAAAVAMVPDGLVLLTSLAFVAGVITLAKRNALAKELATVELLARVDTLFLDKTGTITTGDISFGSVVPMRNRSRDEVADALGAMGAADPNPNPTLAAIVSAFDAPSGWEVVAAEPFSSARKWASVQFKDQGTFWFGAPDILLDGNDDTERELASAEAAKGNRVLLLTHAMDAPPDQLPDNRDPYALILLEDTVRDDAPEILKFFADQGVNLKVISGDNVRTVSAVADRAGVPEANRSMDARELPEDDAEALGEALETTNVFGRVTPHQKRAMVGAYQAKGHVVAMTGDGVNDVLALKDSDMGIAMGSGSSASRGVAQLVLLDNRFATLPEVLAQGRRVINNIERVANLFVTKATYAVLLTAVVGLWGVPFPFLPRHLTLIGTFSIGLPGLFLALAANTNLVRPGFLQRVLRFSIPAGLVAGIATIVAYWLARRHYSATLMEERTTTTLTLLAIGLVILVVVSRPLRLWKVLLAAVMAALYALILILPAGRKYFELESPPWELWVAAGIVALVASVMVVIIPLVVPGLRMGRVTD